MSIIRTITLAVFGEAAIALAWLLSRRTVTFPIASATSLAQLEDILAAADLKLHRDDIVKLSRASAGGQRV